MSTNRSESINYWRWRGSVPPVNPPQPSLPDDDGPPEPRDLSTTELLQEDFFRKPGIHVIFMPKVEEILKMAESAELCRKISEKFFLPDFFFERLGWNANGIFGSTENLSESDTETSYATFSRFLSKHIREVRPNRITPRDPSEEYLISSNASSYEYEWHYMAFCTLWRSSVVNSTDEFTDETNVLVCFDLDDNITLRLKRLLQKADLRHWKNEPFLMLEYALKVVVDRCEDDLWSFQKPMRIVEKSRDEGLFQGIGLVGNDKIFEFLVERYSRLHEISRHVIHISETMDAASNNIGAIIRDHDLWIRSSIHSSTTTRRLSKALLLYENIITNLGLRAKALLARMDNEIHCASNFVAVADSNVSKGILKEGQIFSDTVSTLTVLFLPATFISGFFGMNFFTLDNDDKTQKLQWKTHPKIWIFFGCTIPITILGLFFMNANLLTYIPALVRGIFSRRKTPDPETIDLNNLRDSERPRGIRRTFGFSRRATLRSAH